MSPNNQPPIRISLRIKHFILNRLLIILYHMSKSVKNNSCAGIVFSKDRPLQLDGLLNSYNQFIKNKEPLYVLFTATTLEFENAYNEVKHRHPHVAFIRENNFRNDLIRIVKMINTHKLFFLVDDILITKNFDLGAIVRVNTDYYIPSLRLGKNITYSFMKKRTIQQPKFSNYDYDDQLIQWKWIKNNSYWSYPLSVDGHIFTRKEIEIALRLINFTAPNSLEWALQIFNNYFFKKLGCSFNNSVLVNFPWNKVQTENNNESGNITVEELLVLWNQGKRIDIEKYLTRNFSSAHVHSTLATKEG